MSSKKWAVSLLSVTFAIVIFFGAMTAYLDPLVQYGSESGPLTYRHYTEMYSNPGIAKNYDYNAVFLGSSMVENATVAELDTYFDCKTVKVPYSGASSYNHKVILDVCYRSDNTIDKVFWALDEYALTTEKSTPRYPLPDYLYDDNLSNDLSYLLNLDIFYFYTTKDLFGTLKGRQEIMMKDGPWIDESVYCKQNALASVSYPMSQSENKGKNFYDQAAQDNLQQNILPFLKEHPETEFYFYMVPYSISYWYMCKQNGTLDAEIHIMRTAIEEILKYENAHVFFFQDNEEIITNLDNYKDYSHFHPSVNHYMSEQMALGNHALTLDTYNERLDSFYDYLTTFDYDAFYQNELK